MIKADREQFEDSRAQNNNMRAIVEFAKDLDIDDVMFVSFKEWEDTKIKSPFVGYFHQYLRQTKCPMKFSAAINRKEQGWYIIRTC